MWSKLLLIIIVATAIALIAGGSIPQLSMLLPIRAFIVSILRVPFVILRAAWPLFLIAGCGYFLLKSRNK